MGVCASKPAVSGDVTVATYRPVLTASQARAQRNTAIGDLELLKQQLGKIQDELKTARAAKAEAHRQYNAADQAMDGTPETSPAYEQHKADKEHWGTEYDRLNLEVETLVGNKADTADMINYLTNQTHNQQTTDLINKVGPSEEQSKRYDAQTKLRMEDMINRTRRNQAMVNTMKERKARRGPSTLDALSKPTQAPASSITPALPPVARTREAARV